MNMCMVQLSFFLLDMEIESLNSTNDLVQVLSIVQSSCITHCSSAVCREGE